ncbi:MAG: cytochrome c [Thermodesulfobacteriota bacterium]
MKKMIAFVIAGALFGLGFWNIKTMEASEYEAGRKIYENSCQICHGVRGDGNGPAAAAFNPKPANFTNPNFWQQKDVEKLIANTIEKGHGMMPPVGLKPNEIKAVIEYISHGFKPGS